MDRKHATITNWHILPVFSLWGKWGYKDANFIMLPVWD